MECSVENSGWAFAEVDSCTFLRLFHIQTKKEKVFLKSRKGEMVKEARFPLPPPWASLV